MKKNIFLSLLIITLSLLSLKSFSQKADKASESKVLILTDENFQKNIKKGITLVDFWAVWCGPCRRQAPIIEEIANEVGKKFKISKLDVDVNKTVASQYNVRNIPTLIIFKDGNEVKRMVGVQDKQTLLNELTNIK